MQYRGGNSITTAPCTPVTGERGLVWRYNCSSRLGIPPTAVTVIVISEMRQSRGRITQVLSTVSTKFQVTSYCSQFFQLLENWEQLAIQFFFLGCDIKASKMARKLCFFINLYFTKTNFLNSISFSHKLFSKLAILTERLYFRLQ